MEKLQGPINPYFLAEHLDIDYSLEQEFVANTERLRFEGEEEEEAQYFSLPSLNDTMPFLQMLQSVETPQFLSFQEPNFQTLLRLQQLKKPYDNEHSSSSSMYFPEVKPQVQQALELESCITQLHSPVKSENKDKLLTHQPLSISSTQEPSNSVQKRNCCKERRNSSGQQKLKNQQTQMIKIPSCETRERKKRKRTRPAKNKEEVESQRMTHITVERNRRRQMNENLNALRSLMPTSYVQRGDQASIIGGAIDFVKELEQLLQSLETQKRMRRAAEDGSESSSSISMTACEGMAAENKTSEGREEVLVTVIHNHVNLKIQCQRRPGQLLKAIVALEDLRLTVLHLNITSSHTSVYYSFNLKIEDDCKLGSADEVVAAVHEIFRYINSS